MMTTHGATLGHRLRKLRQLEEAGAAGVPEEKWRQSGIVVPALIGDGHAVIEERAEVVRYLVITAGGLEALKEAGG